MGSVSEQLREIMVSKVEDSQAYDKVCRVLVQIAKLMVSKVKDIQAYDKVG